MEATENSMIGFEQDYRSQPTLIQMINALNSVDLYSMRKAGNDTEGTGSYGRVTNGEERTTSDGGRATNGKGRVADGGGHATNNDGREADSDGRIANDDGREADSDGCITNNDGRIINSDGREIGGGRDKIGGGGKMAGDAWIESGDDSFLDAARVIGIDFYRDVSNAKVYLFSDIIMTREKILKAEGLLANVLNLNDVQVEVMCAQSSEEHIRQKETDGKTGANDGANLGAYDCAKGGANAGSNTGTDATGANVAATTNTNAGANAVTNTNTSANEGANGGLNAGSNAGTDAASANAGANSGANGGLNAGSNAGTDAAGAITNTNACAKGGADAGTDGRLNAGATTNTNAGANGGSIAVAKAVVKNGNSTVTNAGVKGGAKRSAAKGAGTNRIKKNPRDKISAGSFESSMKGINYSDGGYFDRNPNIIFGVGVDKKIIPISEVSTDIEKAAIKGEVIKTDFRPIEGGKRICAFIVMDSAGSVTVKFFIKEENLQFVEPRLTVGIYVTVFGNVQYDAYERGPVIFAIDINISEKEIRSDGALMKRVELHLHTQMSALDAVTPVSELIERAAFWGHQAIAITDHGVIQAFPDAYGAGKKNSIKIIYGVEGYLVNERDDSKSYHIILLVRNKTGLKNLYKLISKAHIEYFYKKPRLPRREIESHREGLIIGSACESGELYRAIVSGEKEERLKEIAGFYDYLEIQPTGNNMFMVRSGEIHSENDLIEFNRMVCRLGDELKKPVVATCDVHFIDREDEALRKVLMAGQNYADADIQAPLYFRTTDEMLEEFNYLGGEKAYEVVVTNTNLVCEMTDPDIMPIPAGTYPPSIPGTDRDLRELAESRARGIYGAPLPDLVSARLEKELESIISNGFSVMYMIALNIVRKSNDEGYFVGSRGSVGSSFVATMIGITEVNPLPPHYVCPSCKFSSFITDGSVASGYDLPLQMCDCGAELVREGQDIPFETFLGLKGAEKAPDIDLNFSGEFQTAAHKYTEELFGTGKVFRAGTIATVGEKTALGFTIKYMEKSGRNLNKAEQDRLVRGCTGVKKTTGQHPGGILIVPSGYDVYDFTPIQRPADAAGSDVITTHFDFHSLHDTILKLDLLGHDDPTIIKMLEDITGVKASEIRINDPKIMSLFLNTEALGVTAKEIGSKVGTYGLPEFGTGFVRQMLVEAKPKLFSDLLQISGLSHGTDVWAKNAQDLVNNGVCTISEVIGTRDNIMVYLMRKGVEQTTAFRIMESVRKGKGLSPEFERNMTDKGVPEWYISSCKKIKYMFPKAHAAAYVLMAYRQAWYKIYRPEAYYAAYFTIRADDFDAGTMTRGAVVAKAAMDALAQRGKNATPKEKSLVTILEIVLEMYTRGIDFLPVDIYASEVKRFMIEGKKLRPPLTSLPGLGEAAAQNIAAARQGSAFLSVEDFAGRAKASKTVVEILRNFGCLEGMDESSQLSFF